MKNVHSILHPTDFSRCADKAFQAACALARDRNAQLVVLHVLKPVTLAGQWIAFEVFERDVFESLASLRKREPDLRIETMVRKGDPARGILSLARELSSDLIVMGAGRSAGHDTAESKVAAEVMRHAPCPVMTVRIPHVEWRSGRARAPLAPAT